MLKQGRSDVFPRFAVVEKPDSWPLDPFQYILKQKTNVIVQTESYETCVLGSAKEPECDGCSLNIKKLN